PAYPSSTRAPAIRGARMLNSVSRSLSDVGRRPSHVGGSRRLPFRAPAITRIGSTFLHWRRPHPRRSAKALALPYFDQLEALFPILDQPADGRGAGLRRVEPCRRLALR